MLKKVQIDTVHGDTAVSAENVTKVFTQWQRENAGKGVIKNLLKPDKKIITALDDVKGVTIVVTSHDMDDLEEMAQRILMISGGKLAYDGSFEGLRDITGNLSRINVTMADGVTPAIPGGRLLEDRNGVFEFEIDLAKHPVKELLYNISQIQNVKDVEIKKAPIEQVIAELYRVWA